MKNKMIKVVIIIGIICIIINLFHLFLGTPIPFLMKYKAGKYITSYLDRKDIKAKYDLKGNYYYHELENGDKIICDFNRKTLHDSSLWKSSYNEVNKKYSSIENSLNLDIILPKTIDIYSEFSLDDFNVKKEKLYILGIKDKRELSDQKSKEKIVDITMQIIECLGKKYHITDLQLSYANLSGYYEVYIDSYDSFIPINKKDVMNHIIKIEEEQWAEDYKKWRKENI